MLLELRAENYAVIDATVAEFGAGLNLLTGETGAGKSILIDALVLLLGGKASSDMVRHGAEKAVLSCVFESTPGALKILEENGVDVEEDGIVLRREIGSNGKGRVFINNQSATVGALRQLAPELALVHAQSETLTAFDATQQRLLLDRSAQISTDTVASAFARWRSLRNELAALNSAESDRLRQIDLWSFQAREIESAAVVDADEDNRLNGEKRLLGNAERLFAGANAALEFLYEGEVSAESLLGGALRHVEDIARFQDSFAEAVQQLRSAQAAVEDVSATLRAFAENATASPQRLADVEDRLVVLDRLKRKYGPSLAAVIAFGVDAAQKLSDLENSDVRAAELQASVEAAAAQYRLVAHSLTEQRKTAAEKLAKVAERQINELAMRTRFSVEVVSSEDEAGWAADGWNTVECRISTNPGEPMKPLTEIASGGEMSRVMLALKVAVEEGAAKLARKRGAVLPRTLVFDEIDIGIGGRAAEAVGQKLKALSRTQQVLCITHLPQIAAFADRHLLIEKNERDGRTRTGVRTMADNERIEEIARMLSGASLTDASRLHAREMVEASR
ncbi:MAG: DNA repair protein RecN [Janthinobacterium lividum]